MKGLPGVYGTAGERALFPVYFARTPISVHFRYTLRPVITVTDPVSVSTETPAYRPTPPFRVLHYFDPADARRTAQPCGFVAYAVCAISVPVHRCCPAPKCECDISH
jgi:hypothetical protein